MCLSRCFSECVSITPVSLSVVFCESVYQSVCDSFWLSEWLSLSMCCVCEIVIV